MTVSQSRDVNESYVHPTPNNIRMNKMMSLCNQESVGNLAQYERHKYRT